jgi:hypothetical protein
MARIALSALVGFLVFLSWPLCAVPLAQDGVAQLLVRLEQALQSGRPDSYTLLLAPQADRSLASAFAASVVRAGVTRVAVRERDRVALQGSPPGEGFGLTVEALVEAGREAMLYTWGLEVNRLSRRAGAAEEPEWVIAGQRILGALPIHHLQLAERRHLTGRQIVVSDEDLHVSIPQADIFVAEADGAPTAVVVLGRGQLRFAPTLTAERGQVKRFSGGEVLESPVDALFLRIPPGELERHLSGTLEPRTLDTRLFLEATEVFREEAGRSFALDLGDLSSESWSMLPTSGDFLAEARTRRFDTLTYSRSSREPEDISLFHRASRRNIAVYASADRLTSRGRFYSDDDGAEYKVLSYEIDASFEPVRSWLEGRTRLRLEVLAPAVATLTLRLADSLAVSSVTSSEYGRLLAVRTPGRHSVVVGLPAPVSKGVVLTIDVAYSGVVTPQAAAAEAIGQLQVRRGEPEVPAPEASFLYSNQTFWYAQAPEDGYSTATLRVRVPEDYSCVASGELVESSNAGVRSEGQKRRYTFVVSRPARYFACLIAHLAPASSRTVEAGSPAPGGGVPITGTTPALNLEVKATPRLLRSAKPLADTASEILAYYASLIGDFPYPDATVAAVESTMPGGHSPAYMAVLNQPLPGATTIPYRDDPAFFDGFPEYYIAHELAHQWWGQAVGWKNYHEQWLSEGLSQYFAALYAGRSRGAGTFDSMIRRFRQWSMGATGEGPIYLGYRVGHIKRDSRLYRAVVYNKSAAVLHMLRRMTGDEAFFRGLRRYYTTWRFRKAGSDDLRQAMEEESGLVLDRFFERWIYSDGVPSVLYSAAIEGGREGREMVVRFEQTGELFDIPVTVTVHYADRAAADVLVKITGQHAETRIPLAGAFKKVEVNRDSAALGKFTEIRSPRG